MLKRIITGILIAGVLFLILWIAGLNQDGYTLFVFEAFILALGAIGSYEIYGAVKKADVTVKEGRQGYRISAISLIVMVVISFPLCYFLKYTGLLLALLISFVTAFILFIFDQEKTFNDFAVNVFALIYPMGIIGLIFVMGREFGLIPVVLAMGISMMSDTMALFVGKAFGKKKIFPTISPKKTYAGCIGGLIGGAIGGVIVYLIFELGNFPTYIRFRFDAIFSVPVTIIIYAAIGLVLAFFSEIGDLAASRVKRSVGIKDYGKILGSHGGILDRIDSILFTTVCMAIIMVIINLCIN